MRRFGSDGAGVDGIGIVLSEEPETQAETALVDRNPATLNTEGVLSCEAGFLRDWDALEALAGEKQADFFESQCASLRDQINLLKREALAARQALEREGRERRAAEQAAAAERRVGDEAVVQQLHSAVRKMETNFGNAYDTLRDKVSSLGGAGSYVACSPAEKEPVVPTTPASSSSGNRGSPRAYSGVQARTTTVKCGLSPVRGAGVEAATGLAVRCSQLEATLGDVRQCLEVETHARHELGDDVARMRKELTQAVSTEGEQRSVAVNRSEEAVSRLEEVARGGVAGLHARVDELTRTVSDRTHADHISSSLRQEIRRQEERVMSNTISTLEARLDEFVMSLKEELNRQEERLSSGGLLHSMEVRLEAVSCSLREELSKLNLSQSGQECSDGVQENNGSTVTNSPLGVRMNELAGILREESRRQDTLEARLGELAGAFHDELRRQEEVVMAEGLSKVEGRLERLAELLREELRRQESSVIPGALVNMEARVTHLAADMREEHSRDLSQLTDILRNEATKQSAAHVDLKEILDALAGRLNNEATKWSSEMGDLRGTVEELQSSSEGRSDREKDLWHALDSHTHDVAVDRRRANNAIAAAATSAVHPAPAAVDGVATVPLAQQRWSTPRGAAQTPGIQWNPAVRLSSRDSTPTSHTSGGTWAANASTIGAGSSSSIRTASHGHGHSYDHGHSHGHSHVHAAAGAAGTHGLVIAGTFIGPQCVPTPASSSTNCPSGSRVLSPSPSVTTASLGSQVPSQVGYGGVAALAATLGSMAAAFPRQGVPVQAARRQSVASPLRQRETSNGSRPSSIQRQVEKRNHDY